MGAVQRGAVGERHVEVRPFHRVKPQFAQRRYVLKRTFLAQINGGAQQQTAHGSAPFVSPVLFRVLAFLGHRQAVEFSVALPLAGVQGHRPHRGPVGRIFFVGQRIYRPVEVRNHLRGFFLPVQFLLVVAQRLFQLLAGVALLLPEGLLIHRKGRRISRGLFFPGQGLR